MATFKEINKIYNRENEREYRGRVPITNRVFSLGFENGIVVSVFYLEVSSSCVPDQVVTRFRGLVTSLREDMDAAALTLVVQVIAVTKIQLVTQDLLSHLARSDPVLCGLRACGITTGGERSLSRCPVEAMHL